MVFIVGIRDKLAVILPSRLLKVRVSRTLSPSVTVIRVSPVTIAMSEDLVRVTLREVLTQTIKDLIITTLLILESHRLLVSMVVLAATLRDLLSPPVAMTAMTLPLAMCITYARPEGMGPVPLAVVLGLWLQTTLQTIIWAKWHQELHTLTIVKSEDDHLKLAVFDSMILSTEVLVTMVERGEPHNHATTKAIMIGDICPELLRITCFFIFKKGSAIFRNL